MTERKLLSMFHQADEVLARPLQAELALAEEARIAAEKAYDECTCVSLTHGRCVHWDVMSATWDAVAAARDVLRESSEPRFWVLREGGYDYSTVEAASAEDALSEARANVDRANYSDAVGTLWIDVDVRCELTGEEASETVACCPEEPDCARGSAEQASG